MSITDSDGAGAQPQASGTGQTQPQVFITAQYIKDMSFENPRAPQSFLQMQQQPEVQVGVEVKAQNLAPGVYEVALTIHVDAKAGTDRVFLCELVYAGITTAQNVPESDLSRILLVDTPRLLFPFARAVIANATREGGFMPLLLRPIDFAEVARAQQAQPPAQNPTAAA